MTDRPFVARVGLGNVHEDKGYFVVTTETLGQGRQELRLGPKRGSGVRGSEDNNWSSVIGGAVVVVSYNRGFSLATVDFGP